MWNDNPERLIVNSEEAPGKALRDFTRPAYCVFGCGLIEHRRRLWRGLWIWECNQCGGRRKIETSLGKPFLMPEIKNRWKKIVEKRRDDFISRMAAGIKSRLKNMTEIPAVLRGEFNKHDFCEVFGLKYDSNRTGALMLHLKRLTVLKHIGRNRYMLIKRTIRGAT